VLRSKDVTSVDTNFYFKQSHVYVVFTIIELYNTYCTIKEDKKHMHLQTVNQITVLYIRALYFTKILIVPIMSYLYISFLQCIRN
jgi:hypothetical protein